MNTFFYGCRMTADHSFKWVTWLHFQKVLGTSWIVRLRLEEGETPGFLSHGNLRGSRCLGLLVSACPWRRLLSLEKPFREMEWKMFGRTLDYEEAVLSLPDTSPKVNLFTPAFVIEVSPFSLPLVTRESWSLRGNHLLLSVLPNLFLLLALRILMLLEWVGSENQFWRGTPTGLFCLSMSCSPDQSPSNLQFSTFIRTTAQQVLSLVCVYHYKDLIFWVMGLA